MRLCRIPLLALLTTVSACASTTTTEPATGESDLSDWKHVDLRSDDVRIAIDYKATGDGRSLSATPVWLNVTSDGLHAESRVRAVFVNYYDSSDMEPNTVESSIEIDLTPADDGHRFTGALPQPVALSRSEVGYGYNFRQELAVVIDGRWVKATPSQNFAFKLTWF